MPLRELSFKLDFSVITYFLLSIVAIELHVVKHFNLEILENLH